MSKKIQCPKCGKKEAKISSTYPDLIVCYCGGDKLNEVGWFRPDDSIFDLIKNTRKINPSIVHHTQQKESIKQGDFVMGIDQSYERSIYMALETRVKVLDWGGGYEQHTGDKALLLKLMYFSGQDYSDVEDYTFDYVVRPAKEFAVKSMSLEELSKISKPKYSQQKDYVNKLNNSKTKFKAGDWVETYSKNNYISGLVLGNIQTGSEDSNQWSKEACLISRPVPSMYHNVSDLWVVRSNKLKRK